MDHIIAQLGPNQVTVQIEPSKYIVSVSNPELPPQITGAGIPDPIKMFERIKYNRQAPSLPPLPPPPPPPRVKVDITPHTLILSVLKETDPKIELLDDAKKLPLIKQFQSDLQKNLDNEKGLFKLFGFARKRSISLEALKESLDKTDKELTKEALLYLAKLLNKRIVIITDMEREEYLGGDSDLLLFKKNPNGIYTHEAVNAAELESELFKRLVQNAELTKAKVASAKIAELRQFAKFVGIKASIKKEIQDALAAKFDTISTIA